MPSFLGRYEGNTREVMDLAQDEMKKRIESIDKFWKWRDGNHPNTLTIAPGEFDDNVKINLCGQVVDDVAEFIAMPEVIVSDEREQMALDALTGDDFYMMLSDAIESSLVAGHGFWKLVLPEEGEPNIDNPVELALLDPRQVIVFWDARRAGLRRSASWYRMVWQSGQSVLLQDIVPVKILGDTLRAQIVNSIGALDDGDWVIIDYYSKNGTQFEIETVDAWRYPFAPIVEWKMGRRAHHYYGESVLTGLPKLNDNVNFVATNTGRIIKHHAHPQTFITGGSLGDMESVVGGVWDGLPPDANIKTIEMQSDLQSSMAFMAMLRSSMFTQARVVDLSSIRDQIGRITNFGVRVLYSNMIKLVENKQKMFGLGLVQALETAMAVMGIDASVAVQWDDPLPQNRIELLQAMELEESLKLGSPISWAREFGRDWQQVIEERQQASNTVIDEDIQRLQRANQMGLFA